MDFLKAEIANKRKAVSPPSNSTTPSSSTTDAPPPQKYLRRRDLQRLQAQQQPSSQKQHSSSSSGNGGGDNDDDDTRPSGTPSSPHQRGSSSATHTSSPAPTTTTTTTTAREGFNISNAEAIRRLRAKGQPIRLFAEGDKERRLRLRALELIEEKGSGAGQNDFRTAMQSAESGMALELLERRNASDKGKAERDRILLVPSSTTDVVGKDGEASTTPHHRRTNDDDDDDDDKKGKEYIGMDNVLDLDLIRRDTARVYPVIYYTLKGLLQQWADELAARPDEVKQTKQGKLAAATQLQSSEYLKPLFKELRKRTLAPDVLMRIAEIVHFMQRREYRFANDSYLQLSIGNAPWPIGVTMVGIHERSGREKIFSSNVAHVLNDEVSRKYIQSLKRLMTFAQGKFPPRDVSMLMG